MIPRNPLSNMTDAQRKEKYISDLKNNDYTQAYSEDKSKQRPLINTDVNKVEFIGGLWRIQKEFNHKITKIHDKEFVIGNKINRSELPKEEFPIFDYYHAATLGLNCYGYILGNFDHIVANCGDAWAYGKDVSGARSKLSGKVIDVVTKNPAMCKMILVEMSKIK